MQSPSNSNISRTKKTAMCGVLTALALIFSYIEFLIPLPIAIPGIKLGLANIVVVVAIYTVGPKYAFFVNFARILLAAAMFGSAFSALYAMAGALVSFAVMVILQKTNLFSCCGVSMAGGVFHNLGQLAVASLLVESSAVFYYFPVLLLSGMATGVLIGVLSGLTIRSLSSALK